MAERVGPPLDEPVFDELAIIGIGLIGSSLARAVHQPHAAASGTRLDPVTRKLVTGPQWSHRGASLRRSTDGVHPHVLDG